MKRTIQMIIAIFLPVLLCGQVNAQHSGPYVGGFIGGNALMKAKSSDDQGNFSLTFDPALQGSAALGWDLAHGSSAGEGRIELEYSRRSNPLDKVKFAEGSFAGGGNLTAESLLLNCYAVFHDKTLWAPYLGIGAGAVRIKASDFTVAGQPLSNDSDVVFAYQVGTGIDITLTDHLSLDLGYRLFGSTRPKFTEVNGRKFYMDYLSHSAVFGLRVGF